LPYAHVEASTPTSIILAALMLKLGGYGVVKFMLPLFTMETHLFFRPLALFICVLGTIYGGLCALRQIDLKRQIAFSSISHMSLATMGIFTFTWIGTKGSIYLMLSHGLTSAALFYLVGVLSDRYHTRSIMAFSGLLSSMPVFSFFLIVMSLANIGFPGTSGFLPELFVLTSVVSAAPATLLPVLLGMLLTTASTLILLLRVLFGHTKTFYFKSSWVDVTALEFYVLMLLTFWVIAIGIYDILT
jgi:NADH-quinone oxidoreductase subunit M